MWGSCQVSGFLWPLLRVKRKDSGSPTFPLEFLFLGETVLLRGRWMRGRRKGSLGRGQQLLWYLPHSLVRMTWRVPGGECWMHLAGAGTYVLPVWMGLGLCVLC